MDREPVAMSTADATEILIVLTLIATPLAVVAIVGLLKGYHMDLKLWKYHRKDDDRNGDQ